MSKTPHAVESAAPALEQLAALGLEEARKLGADAAKVNTSARWERRLVVEAGRFSLANSLASRSIGIAVHKDKKKGSATINSDDKDALRKAVADATALAAYSVPDEFLCLATTEEAPPASPLPFSFDPELADADLEQVQGIMQEVLGVLTRDKRLALDRFEMAADVSLHGTYNSLGVRQTERQTMISWSYMGMARDGEEVTGFDYDSGFSYDLATALGRAMTDADRFAKKILSFLKPRQCPSYKGAVLFSPRAVQELLAGMMLYHMSGRQVMDGKSKWEGSIGQRVLSPLVTITDNPHDGRFSGATSFDGDGLPTRTLTLVQDGVLQLHLHDLYSAKRCAARFGKPVTSNGTAGGPFALAFAPGKASFAELAGSQTNLLMIDRFSGNTDPVKGDFSGVAKSSRLFVRGEDAGAVTETMIAGNFFEIADKLLGLGNIAEIVSGGFQSPYLLLDGLSVTGQG